MQQADLAGSTADPRSSGGKSDRISSTRRGLLTAGLVLPLAAAIPLPVRNEHHLRRTPIEEALAALMQHWFDFPDERKLGPAFRLAERNWLARQRELERAFVAAPVTSVEDMVSKLRFSQSEDHIAEDSRRAAIGALAGQLERLS